ncbi:hypothetical protein [Portibacter lacus]|uniref:Lipocalin-like domain-containing protein n=1 Tax=Portibacter lacus TaxID=1099794 RepID=A0AA37SNB1_9BACT|nr:hypothetical protein [Portibacter lacus]GLR16224.1 hypothetical protein GCM10007940_08390 [Portibacter lacus]
MNKYANRIVFLLVVLLFGCNSDQKSGEALDLEGNWTIYEAYRNNDVTTTLEDGYFKFSDSLMETNILGSPISGKYILDGHNFTHESELPVTYEIDSYVTDSMELNTEIRGFKFKFLLHKTLDTIPSN